MSAAVSVTEKRACLEREIALRARVYPRRVAQGRMTQADADREIAAMRAILRDYEAPDLFAVTRNSRPFKEEKKR